MTITIFYKLLAMFLTVGIGWGAGRAGWLGERGDGGRSSRLLSNVAFYVFVPALLFRTMVRLDFSALPWRTLGAFFVPALLFTLLVYFFYRHRGASNPATPATQTIGAVYGNMIQVGVPVAAALFGERGLALHITLVAAHGLVMLTLLTALVESDLARAHRASTLGTTVRNTVRNTVIHPVTLPVILGALWNLSGVALHPVIDEALAGLGQAVVPVCLVLIGLTLATYDLRGRLRSAVAISALKLLAMPALVLVVAHWGFGLTGMPLAVVVMMGGMPTGSNALIFAQRYDTMQAESTAVIVLSTAGFAVSASLWLGVLAWIA